MTRAVASVAILAAALLAPAVDAGSPYTQQLRRQRVAAAAKSATGAAERAAHRRATLKTLIHSGPASKTSFSLDYGPSRHELPAVTEPTESRHVRALRASSQHLGQAVDRLSDSLKAAQPKAKLLPAAVSPKLPFANLHVTAEQESDEDKAWDKVMNEMYGNAACACVGLDQIDGKVTMNNITYPADVGAHCEAWEKPVDPKCSGPEAPAYCAQKWCYIDPCKCNIQDQPVMSSVKSATYRGRRLYYSYGTCNSHDTWTASSGLNDDTCANKKSEAVCGSSDKCAWDADKGWCGGKDLVETCKTELNEVVAGKSSCRCIGVGGRKGDVKLMLQGNSITYPINIGSECAAWEMGVHTACKGDPSNIPEWCTQKWCYVDPCDCQLDGPPPKTSAGLASALFQGKPIYYSYATCGSHDAFTATEHDAACVNQKSEDQCTNLGDKCAWTGEGCLGKELADACARDEQEKEKDFTEHTPSYNKVEMGPRSDPIVGPIKVQKPKSVAGPPTEPVKDIHYSWKSYDKDWHAEWEHGNYPTWKDIMPDKYKKLFATKDKKDDSEKNERPKPPKAVDPYPQFDSKERRAYFDRWAKKAEEAAKKDK